MATGRLGAEDLLADTDTTLYQCPTETFAAISVNFCNRNNQPALITLAVSATETPDPSDYVEYETELPARGTLERTGVVLAADQYLVIRSNSANVNAVAYGIESALVSPVSVPPSAPPPTPTPTYSATRTPSSIDEGDAVTINVSTTDVDNDTTLYWTVLNSSTTNDDFTAVSGSFTITSNAGSFTVTTVADATTESTTEEFQVQIRTGSTSGTVVATTLDIVLNDTSTTLVPQGFVAMAANGTVALSLDGSSWTSTTQLPGGTSNWQNIAYGSGQFLTFRNSSLVSAVSPDGTNWTQQELPNSPPRIDVSNNWQHAAYGDGLYIIASAGESGVDSGNISSSTALTGSWTENGMVGTLARWAEIVYGNGTWLALAGSEGASLPTTQAATSTDGVTWTLRTMPVSTIWGGVAYGGGQFVAVSRYVDDTFAPSSIAATSSDGITWTQRTMPASRNWSAVAYGNDIFVAVSGAGNQGISNVAAVSSDGGASWTQTTLPAFINWTDITFGNGLFMALGYDLSFAGNTSATSPDGVTWTVRLLPSNALWLRVAYGDGYGSPTYAVAPASSSVDEGSSLVFTVTTANVSSGTDLYWTVTNAADFVTASGTVTITSNTGTFSVTPTADATLEGAETFTASVRTGSTSGTVVATSSTVTINDTSTAPAFIPDFTITVTNSGNNYIMTGVHRYGTFTDVSQPSLYFLNGDRVRFIVNAGTASNHPFYIKTTQSTGTDNQVSGVDGQGTTQLDWTVATDGPGTYGYQCSIHLSMWNIIIIPQILPAYTGMTWNTISKPATTEIAAAYVEAGTRIIVVPSTSNNRTLWESVAGGNFSTVTLPLPSIDQRAAGIAKNNASGRIVVIGSDLTASWVSTDDGFTWTAHDISSLTKPDGTTTAYPPRIAFVDGVFKVVMGNAPGETDLGISAYSTDGITWTQGVFNPSIRAEWFTVPTGPSNQSEVLWGSIGLNDRYYYSAANTPDGEVISQSISPSIQFGPGNVNYASDLGYLAQYRARGYLLIESDITALSDSTSVRSTHSANGGGEGVGVLDVNVTNQPTVVLIGPWTATNTWRVNYNLAGSAAWQDTTLPGSPGGGVIIVAKQQRKFYVFHFNSLNVYVGSMVS